MGYLMAGLLTVAIFVMIMVLRKKEKHIQKINEEVKKVQRQITLVQSKAFDLEKIRDDIWDSTNTIHLYASVSKENAKSESVKQNQIEILKLTENIFGLIEK